MYAEAQPWVFSHYVHLLCEEDKRNKGRLFIDYAPRASKQLDICPWIIHQYMLRDTYTALFPDFIAFIENSLGMQNYVYMLIDQKFIPECEEGWPHETFIYGFDKQSGICNVADFTFSSNGQYAYTKTNIENLKKGSANITTSKDYMKYVHLLRFNREAEYEFDKEWLKTSLRDYQRATNPYDHYRHMYNRYICLGYGAAIYDIIIDDAIKCVNEGKEVDIRMLHNIYDHKVFMLKRVEFLLANGMIRSSDLYSKSKKMSALSNALRLSAMKNNLKPRSGWINTFSNAMLELKSIENELIDNTLREL